MYTCSVLAALCCCGCRLYDRSLVEGEDSRSTSPDGLDNSAGRPNTRTGSSTLTASTSAADQQTSCSHGQCWWSVRDTYSCSATGFPVSAQRVQPDAEAGTNLSPIYLAWFHTQLGETTTDPKGNKTTWQQLGFDLDNTCTNASGCEGINDVVSCQSSVAGLIPFDGELCRDNTFGNLQSIAALVPELGGRFGLSQARVNCGLWRGEYSIVMRISDYNGSANDDSVRLDVYVSPGLERLPPWQCPNEEFDALYPRWRQPSSWYIDSQTLRGPIEEPGVLPDSAAFDDHAYVREGYLVAALPDEFLLRFAGDGMAYRGFALNLVGSIWTGRLERGQDRTWSLSDGILAARLRQSDFVRAFREIGLCEGGETERLYADILGYIRDGADILVDGSVDPQRTCDAISLAIAFEAAAITPGTESTLAPLVECCPPDRPLADCTGSCGDGRLNADELCDTAIAPGEPGSCPTSCASEDPCLPRTLIGSGCYTACAAMPVTEIGVADGCCASTANSTVDVDCNAVCGNGVVEGSETCDPPGSCPACVTTDRCLDAAASGSSASCNVTCTFTPKNACQGGDGCCPNNCAANTDSDCSATCGNGVVDNGELCEPNGNPACPASCDDGDPCTADMMSGLPEHCNVTCAHIAVQTPNSGDGCCPASANASTDSDCAAVCGNGKLDPMEQCDDGNTVGGDGCSPSCSQESPAERCDGVFRDSDVSQSCAACVCANCGSETLGCLDAEDDRTRMLCTEAIQCAARTGCAGIGCYCGNALAPDCLNLPGAANGPCLAPIVAAAGTDFPPDVLAASANPSTPLGLSWTQRTCVDALCRPQCSQ